jgi:hypothetical protein
MEDKELGGVMLLSSFCFGYVIENTRGQSKATTLRGKLSLYCFDVSISMTYNEREKGMPYRMLCNGT